MPIQQKLPLTVLLFSDFAGWVVRSISWVATQILCLLDLQEFLTFPDEGQVNWSLGSSTHCEKPVKYNNGFYVTL